MSRVAVVVLLVLGIAIVGSRTSHADNIIVLKGVCFESTPTLIPTPCPTPTPTRSLITPTKSLSVSGGIAVGAGVTNYTVNLTSQFACFSIGEPIDVYAFGNTGQAELSPVFPYFIPAPGSGGLEVHVDRTTGTAQLSLEVRSSLIGPAGLAVKAVWPQENVERVAVVVPPAAPTTTPTGQPTSTPTSTATATPTSTATPVTTGTPSTATAQATPTATAVTGPLTVQACVSPPVLSGHSLGGESGTLYGLTQPGAVCSPSISYSNGGSPTDTAYLTAAAQGQTALADGLVIFPFTEDSTGTFGVAHVTCALPGQTSVTGCTVFPIAQTNTSDLLNLTGAKLADLLNSLRRANCPPGT